VAPDNLVVNDLSGTDVDHAAGALAASGGGDDNAADTVVANATNGDDVAIVSGAGPSAQVTCLAATLDGGDGDDVLIDGPGNDTLDGRPATTWSSRASAPTA